MAALLTCFAAAGARAEHVDVFILAGQSNMDGRGKKSELTGPLAAYAKPRADVKIAYSNSTKRGPYASNSFVPLEPGYSVPPGTKKPGDSAPPFTLPGSTFGPEVSFGRAIADAMPGKRVALIKFSEGGTTLRADWSPDVRDALYDQFLAFTLASLKSLTDRGDTYTLAGMIWHQGESDASLPPGEYQRLLTRFIARVRTDLSATEMPFVIGEVFDNGKRDRVRAGQRATSAAVAATYFVSAAGLNTSDAGTHFDTPSQIELGQRLARALKTRASVEPPTTAPSR